MATTFPTTVTTTHENSGGTVTQTRNYATETLQPLKVSLNASEVDRHVQIAIPDPTKLKTLIIKTPVDVDICTNDDSAGDPDQTLELASEMGLTWDKDSGFDCPIIGPVTDLYFTNQEAVAVPAIEDGDVIEILMTFDPTP